MRSAFILGISTDQVPEVNILPFVCPSVCLSVSLSALDDKATTADYASAVVLGSTGKSQVLENLLLIGGGIERNTSSDFVLLLLAFFHSCVCMSEWLEQA